jgi:acyl-CoA synthetase (AMP-forming)/AMP-acid ligase II
MTQGIAAFDCAMTIPAVLERAQSEFGDDEALVDGSIRWTYARLREESLAVARALDARGIEPGDRVALWAGNSARWIAASFGVYQMGAVLVPVNTRFKRAEAAHVLRRSRSRLLLGSTELLGTDLLGLLGDTEDLPDLEATIALDGPNGSSAGAWEEFIESGIGGTPTWPSIRPEDPSDVIFTSGTTGSPKGAVLSHGPSVQTYVAWTESVGLRRGDRYLCVYPFFHTAGLKSGVLACVLRGATLLPQAVFEAESVMRRVQDETVTVLPGPPTVFQSILAHPDRARFDLSSLRLSVTGAASVPVEVVRRMREDLRITTVVTGYGLTETTGTVSMCRHDDSPEVIATTVGRPLEGVEIKVVDDDEREVGVGGAGEILVRGFNVMAGYFDDEEATRAAIDNDSWLRTGDIGFVGEDGNLRITDRKKDMFIVGGFNAFPAEIEGIMLSHPEIAQVAVVGVPDDRLGEVGHAFVVPRDVARFDEAEVLIWCRDNMANYKVPRRLAVVHELPLTASGKVQRFRLRTIDSP